MSDVLQVAYEAIAKRRAGAKLERQEYFARYYVEVVKPRRAEKRGKSVEMSKNVATSKR